MQSFIIVPVLGGVRDTPRRKRVIPSFTRGSARWLAVSCAPGLLPARQVGYARRPRAPEFDCVGLVAQTVVFLSTIALKISPIVTGRPTNPRRCISDFQPANTIGVVNMGWTSLSTLFASPSCSNTELANQNASYGAFPSLRSRAWSTEPSRV